MPCWGCLARQHEANEPGLCRVSRSHRAMNYPLSWRSSCDAADADGRMIVATRQRYSLWICSPNPPTFSPSAQRFAGGIGEKLPATVY